MKHKERIKKNMRRYQSKHRKKLNEKSREYYKKHRELITSKRREKYKLPEVKEAYRQQWLKNRNNQSLIESARIHRLEYTNRRKIEFLNLVKKYLGDKCSNPDCLIQGGCTDWRCLQIDHINGGGTASRRHFRNGFNERLYYIKHPEKITENLQILCANCNWIKRVTNNELKR